MATEGTPILATTGFVTIAVGLVLLLIGYQQAKTKKFANHKKLMGATALVNLAFLIQYIIRYLSGQETPFSGPETVRNFVYLPILFIHITISIVVIVLVVTQISRSIKNEQQSEKKTPYFEKDYRSNHRSFGRKTFYLWVISYAGGISIFLLLYVLY